MDYPYWCSCTQWPSYCCKLTVHGYTTLGQEELTRRWPDLQTPRKQSCQWSADLLAKRHFRYLPALQWPEQTPWWMWQCQQKSKGCHRLPAAERTCSSPIQHNYWSKDNNGPYVIRKSHSHCNDEHALGEGYCTFGNMSPFRAPSVQWKGQLAKLDQHPSQSHASWGVPCQVLWQMLAGKQPEPKSKWHWKEGRKKECDQPSLALATHERGTSNCMQSPHRWRHPKLRTSSSGRTWRSWWWCRNFRNHKFHLWTPLALKAALVPSTGCVLPLAWRGWFGGGGCPVGPRFMRRAWNCVS